MIATIIDSLELAPGSINCQIFLTDTKLTLWSWLQVKLNNEIIAWKKEDE